MMGSMLADMGFGCLDQIGVARAKLQALMAGGDSQLSHPGLPGRAASHGIAAPNSGANALDILHQCSLQATAGNCICYLEQ